MEDGVLLQGREIFHWTRAAPIALHVKVSKSCWPLQMHACELALVEGRRQVSDLEGFHFWGHHGLVLAETMAYGIL
jgi:hypothetical protein